jgi:hypothetical protein
MSRPGVPAKLGWLMPPSLAAADLYWIPLGAGGHSVRFNYRYTIEIAPSPDADEAHRGVVAMGAVGSRHLGRLRLFRYEVPLLARRVHPGPRLGDRRASAT